MDNTGFGYNAERQLWCAVIRQAREDAICRLGRYVKARNQAVAKRWFIEETEDFDIVCELAGFAPQFVRDRAIKDLELDYNPF